MCIDIDEENIASRTIFEKCGYRPVGYGENQKSVLGGGGESKRGLRVVYVEG